MMDLYGNGLLLGEKTLDSLWMRQNLTMNNIANVDTPGFKVKVKSFAPRQIQRRSFAALAITLSRKIF